MATPDPKSVRSRWSIHAHLSLLVSVVIVPLVLLTAYLVWDRAREEAKEARESTLRLAESAARNIQEFIRDSDGVITSLAQQLRAERAAGRNSEPRLKEFQRLHPDCMNVFIADARGRIVASAEARPAGQTVSSADTDWFQEVQKTRRFTVSNARLGQITKKWVVVVAVPLTTGTPGKPVEVLGVSVDPSRFQRAIEGVPMPRDSVIAVVDRTGSYVARVPGGAQWRGQSASDQPHVRAAMSSVRGHLISTGSDRVPRNYSYTKVGSYGWSVLVGLPEREVLSGAWSNATTSLWLVLSVMIVVVGMVWIIGQRIRRPINALARSSQAIVEQRSSEPLRLSGPREVALAADSFNRMLEARLQSDDALQRSERRYRLLFEASPLPMWVFDLETRKFLAVNLAAVKLYGYTTEEFLAMTVDDLRPAEETREPGQSARKVTTALGQVAVWRHQKKGGTNLLVQISSHAVEFGGRASELVLVQDVTSRVEAERALRRGEQRFRSLVAATSAAVWTMDATGKVVDDLPSWRNFTGQAVGEIMGDGWLKALPPEDQPRVIAAWKQALVKQRSFELEFRLRRADGDWRQVLSRAVPLFSPDGKLIEWVGVCHDITERRLAENALREREERLRLALEVARIATWELDLRTQAVKATKEISQMFGGPTQPQLLTIEQFMERIHPDDRAGVGGAVNAAIQNRTPYHHQFRVVWCDGAVHWLEGRGEVFNEPDGRPHRMIGVTVDISELKQAEQERRELSARLQRAQDEERRRLARELHDATAQKLVALTLNLSRLVRGVEAADERIRNLTADSLRLAEQSAQEIRIISYLLHPPLLEELGLVGALRNYTEGFVRRSGVQVELIFPEPMERLPFEVELAVFRMVQESLTNVYRHSGSPRAEIEIRRDGARLEVEVRDQGHGIPSAAPREADLFEAAGVGMAGMRERLRSLGGELEIESSPQGTRVMARIPNAPSVTSSSPFQLTHE